MLRKTTLCGRTEGEDRSTFRSPHFRECDSRLLPQAPSQREQHAGWTTRSERARALDLAGFHAVRLYDHSISRRFGRALRESAGTPPPAPTSRVLESQPLET